MINRNWASRRHLQHVGVDLPRSRLWTRDWWKRAATGPDVTRDLLIIHPGFQRFKARFSMSHSGCRLIGHVFIFKNTKRFKIIVSPWWKSMIFPQNSNQKSVLPNVPALFCSVSLRNCIFVTHRLSKRQICVFVSTESKRKFMIIMKNTSSSRRSEQQNRGWNYFQKA